jgi:hydrogenase expression/formation protein HypC
MCVAVPGKIIEINGNIAKINVLNNITEADIRLVSAKPGDYVLLHAGCALEIMKKDAAEELIALFQEIGEL